MNKNAVISEVGEYGVFETWLSKDYDIYLFNYDGKLPDSYDGLPNVYVIKDTGMRFELYDKAIKNGTFDPSKYEYIIQTDNDVEMYPDDINKIFQFAKENNLDWCTPSFFNKPGYNPWDICVNYGQTGIGFVNVIDQMCCCYSQSAFMKIKDYFCEAREHGWGFEFMWSKLIHTNHNVAILYDIVVKHIYEKGNIEQQPDYLYTKCQDTDFVGSMFKFIDKYDLKNYMTIRFE